MVLRDTLAADANVACSIWTMARPALHCAGEINIKTNIAHSVDTKPDVGHDAQCIAQSAIVRQQRETLPVNIKVGEKT